MTDVDVRTAAGATSGKVELPAEIFDVQVNVPLIHQVVVAQLAAARQGTHDTKRRGEVSGGGRKPYKQKGTGRARQGSIRAPHYKGGGVAHGPHPRDYAQRTPKKMKAAALRGALSDRARDDDLAALSLRNVPTVHVLYIDQLNTYDVLVSDYVLFTEASLEIFVAGAPAGKSVKAVAAESEVEA